MPGPGLLLLALLGVDGDPLPAGMVRIAGGVHPRPCLEGSCEEVHSVSTIDRSLSADAFGRSLWVDAFDIDRTEVTVAAYAGCVAAGYCARPGRGAQCNADKRGKADHPVNCVNWAQAQSYCAWTGKRLPRWIEWDRAAFGADPRRIQPWGEAEPSCARAVFRARTELVENLKKGCGGLGGTQVAGSRDGGASPEGAVDLVGNVSEWLFDWRPSESEPRRERLHAGGDWASGPDALGRIRGAPPTSTRAQLGFRCVQSSSF
ncbi:MAG: SUMF1/EgtB/PvdO family nonheme iron enzyme [Myxococcota bacterium]